MQERDIKRRLAAIVAADVAGYSRLTGRDEEGTIARLRAHRRELIDPKIREYGGRTANTAGDSLLVEFPSVVDALRCSIELQSAMRERNEKIESDERVEFRIGINLGDVIEEDGDLLGDGVNVAARLEGLAQPGGICLSRAARDQVRDKLAISFEDLGEVEVKNIARPIRAFRVGDGTSAGAPSPEQSWNRSSWQLLVALAGAVVMVVTLGVAAWYFLTQEENPYFQASGATKASIAVLPFSNLSQDTEQSYFSDGISNDLITDLSKFRDLFVIASNTAFAYGQDSIGARNVGRELGVRYVLEGSVQKLGDRVRINVQLVDTESGQHLWAERYDKNIDDLFDLQDEMTLQIVRTLAVRLTRLEQERALTKPTRNLEAYDYVLRGQYLQRKSRRSDNLEARSMFERALEIDPDYSLAYVGLGQTYLEEVLFGWTGVPNDALEQAQDFALKARSIDEDSDRAHSLLASTYLLRRQYEQALVESERAIALNPNDPNNYAEQGAMLVWSSHAEGAVRALETALNFDPMMGARPLTHLGLAYYLTGRYEEAITVLERALGLNPDFAYGHTVLAATYAMNDEQALAVREAAEVRRLDPFFSLEQFGRLFRNPADAAALVEGLRKAGLE